MATFDYYNNQLCRRYDNLTTGLDFVEYQYDFAGNLKQYGPCRVATTCS